MVIINIEYGRWRIGLLWWYRHTAEEKERKERNQKKKKEPVTSYWHCLLQTPYGHWQTCEAHRPENKERKHSPEHIDGGEACMRHRERLHLVSCHSPSWLAPNLNFYPRQRITVFWFLIAHCKYIYENKQTRKNTKIKEEGLRKGAMEGFIWRKVLDRISLVGPIWGEALDLAGQNVLVDKIFGPPFSLYFSLASFLFFYLNFFFLLRVFMEEV